RFVLVSESEDGEDRAEQFLLGRERVHAGTIENGGEIIEALVEAGRPAASSHKPRAGGEAGGNDAFDPVALALRGERAEFGLVLARIADADLRRLRGKFRQEP